jgi:D-alanyl-D-alanine carboxypeptidase
MSGLTLGRRTLGRGALGRGALGHMASAVAVTLLISIAGVNPPTTNAATNAVPTSSGPPACTYADTVTPLAKASQWQTTLVDTILRVPASYVPPLASVAGAGFGGGYRVRPEVISDLAALRRDAADAGAPLKIVSAYRSYSTQTSTFNGWVSRSGRSAALLASARSGHSEHQLGTAIDFTSAGGGAPWNYRDWATTRAGAWMQANAWRYGFVLSYPRGATATTCYQYEPWHFRYFDRPVAADIEASGMTTRDYLWAAGSGR